MGHDHAHSTHGKSLFWAIVINIILTIAQIIGGVLSGSLSLIADALHNLSDAGALVIAYVAQKVSGLPANSEMTFGYGRAQILGALINSVTLVVVGLYLLYEAWARYLEPTQIDGWMVIWIATIALAIDLLTAWLTHSGAKESINMRAAFIHNLSDAMASVVVIVSGVLILNYEVFWVDLIATVLISLYVLYQSLGLIKSCGKTLMQAVPEDIDRSEVIQKIQSIKGVNDIHHVHIWAIHEKFKSLEAHVVVDCQSLAEAEEIKKVIKNELRQNFKINHSTIEIERDATHCRK